MARETTKSRHNVFAVVQLRRAMRKLQSLLAKNAQAHTEIDEIRGHIRNALESLTNERRG